MIFIAFINIGCIISCGKLKLIYYELAKWKINIVIISKLNKYLYCIVIRCFRINKSMESIRKETRNRKPNKIPKNKRKCIRQKITCKIIIIVNVV
jgi:hypothetical protein